jgi:phenylacetate-coenzyme A ligase PaaK-like adenylate-forming protein
VVSADRSQMDRAMVERFAAPYEQHLRWQEELLAEITTQALRSPVYSDRIWSISSLEGLSALPLTPYESILECTERVGLDKILLGPMEQSFHTSGSTGKPKRFYHGKEDIERIVSEYAMVSHIIGIRPGQKAWNLGGPLPDVSGYILAQVGSHLDMSGSISTLLKDDKDLIRALRRASSEKDIDLLSSPALILYLIGRMSNEPGFLNGLIEDKAIRSYHVPRPLAKLVRRLYLRGIDMEALKNITDNVRIAISYAEPLNPYMGELKNCYPHLQIFDFYGSTENPIMAAQIDPTVNGLSMFINTIIPELASPEDVVKGKADPSFAVKGVLWNNWKEGMIGELIITRPGQCLPLVRYPTGDVVQVLDPAHEVRFEWNGDTVTIMLPLIRILGRSVETLDFDAQDESGNYLGMKFYSRYVNEALHRSSNVRWWEMYNILGTPSRLAMVVIPETDPSDIRKFKSEIVRRLTKEKSDIPHSFQTANDLGKLEIIVLPSNAYNAIQAEIDRRIKEGRSYGQLKPKHIYVMANESEFNRIMRVKFAGYLPPSSEEKVTYDRQDEGRNAGEISASVKAP